MSSQELGVALGAVVYAHFLALGDVALGDELDARAPGAKRDARPRGVVAQVEEGREGAVAPGARAGAAAPGGKRERDGARPEHGVRPSKTVGSEGVLGERRGWRSWGWGRGGFPVGGCASARVGVREGAGEVFEGGAVREDVGVHGGARESSAEVFVGPRERERAGEFVAGERADVVRPPPAAADPVGPRRRALAEEEKLHARAVVDGGAVRSAEAVQRSFEIGGRVVVVGRRSRVRRPHRARGGHHHERLAPLDVARREDTHAPGVRRLPEPKRVRASLTLEPREERRAALQPVRPFPGRHRARAPTHDETRTGHRPMP